MASISIEMLQVLIPQIGLLVLTVGLLAISLLKNGKVNGQLGWITSAGIGLLMAVLFLWGRPENQQLLLWGGMIRFDQAGFLFTMLFLAGAGLTALFSTTEEAIQNKPEFYLLLILSTIGLSLMAVAGNLILLYLALETASIPLYVLAGIKYRDSRSVESGIKYFLFGIISSAVMLFGFSLLYGFSGTTSIYSIQQGISSNQVPLVQVAMAAILVLVGFAFKISAVPFHFWAPDVYEGSPTPVAGFLSTVSKAAGFAALIRVLLHVFGAGKGEIWMLLLAIMSAITMIVGNLLAIPQKNLKRMIAFSSIAQAGYILVGVASGTEFGFTAAVYYLMAYLVTNLAVFAIIGWVERSCGSSDISAFAGLNRRAPGMALLLMIALLSLGGIPPFAGFMGKVLVFGAAIQNGLIWLAVLGVLNSVVGLYYYLRVMKVMYLDEYQGKVKLIKAPVIWYAALAVCILGILILGIFFTPWFSAASLASIAF
jgi:NADH-quinone oxidoreductase subunit N